MRIYIISDDADRAILAANVINSSGNSGIISETAEKDQKDLLADLKSNMDGSDSAVVICSEAKNFAIQANKNSRFRAVACKDSEDAEEAAQDAGANIIVIDSQKSTRAQTVSIIHGWLGGDYKTASRQRAELPAKDMRVQYKQQKAEGKTSGGFRSLLGLGDEEAVEQEQEQKQPQKAQQSRKLSMPNIEMPKITLKMPKDITKSIKNALGLDDGEEK